MSVDYETQLDIQYQESDKTVKERLKDLKGDINLLVARLDEAPRNNRDITDINHEGWLFMTASGKLSWKKYFARLTADLLSFFVNPTDTIHKAQFYVCYYTVSTVSEEDTLTGKQIKEGLFCKKRIKLITPEEMLDISFESDGLGDKWAEVLETLISRKYTKEEIREKENAKKELEPLLISQQKLLFEKYMIIINALANSGFWIAKEKKLREGYCYLKRQGKHSKKLYVVLYKDFIYFFKPQARVSLNERPYYMINLKFVTACDMENSENLFSITTPLRKFTLRTKHEVALQEWVNKIRENVSKKNKYLAPLKPIQKIQNDTMGYQYSKPINKYLSVIETFEDGRQKVHKLSKAGESTIGRSSSNTVTLTADKYISRSHCKIVVENNVPFLMDLGQSKDGTRLNGKRITKAPLKPGDLIGMGKSDIIFQVKNGGSIFSCTNGNFQQAQEESNSFSSSEKDPSSIPLVVRLDTLEN